MHWVNGGSERKDICEFLMNFKQVILQNVQEGKEHMHVFKFHFLNLRKNRGKKHTVSNNIYVNASHIFRNKLYTYVTEELQSSIC